MEEDVVQDLQKNWLPQLRQLKSSRERTIRLVQIIFIGLTIISVALIILIFVDAIANNNFRIELAGGIVFAIGLLILFIIYLCKLQGCNDALVAVECYVHLRDAAGLGGALSKIECLSQLREMLDDFQRVTKSKP